MTNQDSDRIKEEKAKGKWQVEPSSSLHTKLQTIVLRLGWLTEADDIDQVIKDLTQAFKEAGWIDFEGKVKELNPSGQITIQRMESGITEVVMTGQEFYDRFKAEIEKQSLFDLTPDEFTQSHKEYLAAARRAAGVSE